MNTWDFDSSLILFMYCMYVYMSIYMFAPFSSNSVYSQLTVESLHSHISYNTVCCVYTHTRTNNRMTKKLNESLNDSRLERMKRMKKVQRTFDVSFGTLKFLKHWALFLTRHPKKTRWEKNTPKDRETEALGEETKNELTTIEIVFERNTIWNSWNEKNTKHTHRKLGKWEVNGNL